LLRSLSNTLLSVRQVAQRNKGRVTAGIDGQVALTLPAVAKLATDVHQTRTSWQPLAVKRVYIPKARDKTKLRPLGIPVIMDRCHQARVRHALEPEWEARFEPRSYGFRPGRGCQDAIEAIFNTLRGKTARRLWILDADLEAAFDRLDHDHLLGQLGSFPARGLIRGWLKAGVFEPGKGFAPTEQGSPQGGVISPLLLNVALHGLEQAAGVRYLSTGVDAGDVRRDSPVMIRYADDMLALCHTRQQAEQIKAQLAEWLQPRGLAFNETKTHIIGASQGCDFLGFSIRRYPNGKLLIKPSTEAKRRVRERLAAEVRSLRGNNAVALIARLNPKIRGWAAYYRHVVSGEVFNTLDTYVWNLTYRWALRGHRNKPKRWIVDHHYGAFHPARNDRWVFGDRHSGSYLVKFSWTRIVRHQMVKGGASPHDPALTDYWNTRRGRNPPPLGRSTLRRLQAQHGRCPLCGDYLLLADHQPASPTEWEQWLTATRKAITKQAITTTESDKPDDRNPRLIHTHCQKRHTNAHGNSPEQPQPPALPSRLA
jgi:RNA-directed DNA polymerase